MVSRAWVRRVASIALALACVSAVSVRTTRARADEPSVAEQLFLEGKALMLKRQYEKACSTFKASHDLDPTATGTLLNLALCHEQIGKMATAWAEYRQVAAESEGRRADRVQMAREHEAKLAPLLEHIVVEVDESARVPGLVVQLDRESSIPEAMWQKPIAVDAGSHVVEASAPGKVNGTYRVFVGARDGEGRIIVKALANKPIEKPAAEAEPDRTRRNIGFAAAGAGVVTLVIGVIFGADAIAKNHSATGLCPGDVCSEESVRNDASSRLSSAHSAATASNVFFVIGGVAVATGAVLVLTAPKPLFGKTMAVGTNGSGAVLMGSW